MTNTRFDSLFYVTIYYKRVLLFDTQLLLVIKKVLFGVQPLIAKIERF